MQKNNLQDIFLTKVRKQSLPVTVFLMNGFQLRGSVTGFDSFTVVLDTDGKQQVIYKHAISTIIPVHPVPLNDKSYELKVDPTFYAMGGYKFRFRNPQYAVATDALLRTDLSEWRADVSVRLMYDGAKHKLYGGVMYSPTYSVGVMLGINFHGINIGYSYEVYTGGIGALNGTHEVMLGYQTDLNLFKKGKNKHKSVRICILSYWSKTLSSAVAVNMDTPLCPSSASRYTVLSEME